MAQQTEQKIQAVHMRLDDFELRVLARPTPTIDLTTLQAVIASLRADKRAEPESAHQASGGHGALHLVQNPR